MIATVILDSGCFLKMPPRKKNIPRATEIGYFQSSESIPDIRIRADGNEIKNKKPINLGEKCKIEVRHVLPSGRIKRDGIKGSPTFRKHLLHMRDLYGEDVAVNREKFDCILRFETGLFCGALIKNRTFKQLKRKESGEYKEMGEVEPKEVKKAIMHNVFIHFKLKKGEAVELARDGEVFWSSKGSGATDHLVIEIVADNTTSEKFYGMAFESEPESYWMPNQGDPPPVCSQPPCEP